MKYHLVINNYCNLDCKYCSQMAFDEKINSNYDSIPKINTDEMLPSKLKVSIPEIIEFLRKDKDPPENKWLIFYGGEPLLSIVEIEEIIERIDFPINYAIQTNGTLLDKISSEKLKKLKTILVSIDGQKENTDFFRGTGIYQKIINNLKIITKNGYSGNIIARMTIMEPTDIYKEVIFLLNNPEFKFKEIHWQLNANFYPDFEFRNWEIWIKKSYLSGIEKLVDYWVKEMKTGKVIKLYPFLGIINRIFELEEGTYEFETNKCYLPCGSGFANYSLQTDGKIIPCPIMVGMKDFYLGEITDNPEDLKKKQLKPSGKCQTCDILKICGGRCLYSNLTNPWKEKEFELLCQITRKTIEKLETKIPEIKKLIKEGKIKRKDFDFEKYIGPEIIP